MLPEYPLSREEQEELNRQKANDPTAFAEHSDLPSDMGFAREVRQERLSILWKITLFSVFMAVWVVIVLSGGRNFNVGQAMLPTLTLTIGSVLTARLLAYNRLEAAVWAFGLGGIAAVGFTMAYGGKLGTNYIPFVFPVLAFMLGLLLPVRDTLVIALVILAAAVGFPSLAEGKLVMGEPPAFALVLTVVATALSAQVSGELYAIAEWAIDNYRKERQTTFALFDSREALQKSFLRQQALTKQVQETNAELEAARTAAEEAKNFRGQFLANMSHELRTPLNAIIGFSQTMLDFPAMYDGVELPPQYRQDMTQLLTSGKHLLNIINDILDLSKVDAGKLDLEIQPVDLGPVVKGVLSTAVGLVGEKKERVKLLKELPEPLPMVLADPLRVRQVLLNIYSNAAKFTDSGHIKLRVWTEGKETIFAVEDTGIGIAESDKTTIFEEFRQGTAGRKKGRQGAGLGLAISLQLLRLMNGRMWFESKLGKGTTFFIALPLYVPGAEEAPADGKAEGKAAPTTSRISRKAASTGPAPVEDKVASM